MLDIFRKGTKTVSLVLKYRAFKVAFLFNLQLILSWPFMFILACQFTGLFGEGTLKVDFNLHFGKENVNC